MINVLISFAEGARACEQFTRPGWRVLLDSGAYANHTKKKPVVTLDGYRAYLLAQGHLYWRYFNLDVIGDPIASAYNLAALEEAGLRPIPVFQRGGQAQELRALLSRYELVGIGGIAGRLGHKSHMDYLEQVMSIAGTDRRRTHLLGCGDQRVLKRFSPYSADSSSQAMRGGSLNLYWRGKFNPIKLRGKLQLNGQANEALCSIILNSYGINLETALNQKTYGDRSTGAHLVCRSYLRFQQAIRSYGIEYFIVHDRAERLQAAVDAETLATEIYLVGCGKDKLPGRHRAGQLYTGTLFKKALGHAQARGRALILSAEHGLVDPEQELDAYDRTLNTMSASDRAAWGERVMGQLRERGITRAIALAGSAYIDPLRERGLDVQDPMAGLGIGSRLKWLTENP